MDPQRIIEGLGLEPLPSEGGFYRETYRSREKLAHAGLPDRYGTDRHFSTAIYYLLTRQTFSAIHRLASDEVFHFYSGAPVTMLRLFPDGHGEQVVLGSDISAGQVPQSLVPKGVWQGACLGQAGEYALMGTTVAPGFDCEDFELAHREDLVRDYPRYADLIRRLTRQ